MFEIINKHIMTAHFSRQATRYDQYATMQRESVKRLLNLLDRLYRSNPQNILELGCGTGELTLGLIKRYPHAQIFINDISPQMLDVALNKINQQCPESRKRIVPILGDGEALESHNLINNIPQNQVKTNTQQISDERPHHVHKPFDLIISANTFQWYNQPQSTLTNYYRDFLNEGGQLIFSVFAQHTFKELRQAIQLAENELQQKYPQAIGQKLFPLTEWQETLKSIDPNAFVMSEEYELKEYYPNSRTFIQAIKEIGANNALKGEKNKASLINKKLLLKMLDIYDQQYKEGDQVKATGHIINMSIFKPSQI